MYRIRIICCFCGLLLILLLCGCRELVADVDVNVGNWPERLEQVETLTFNCGGEEIRVSDQYQLEILKVFLEKAEEIEKPAREELPRKQAGFTFYLPEGKTPAYNYYYCDIRTCEPAYVDLNGRWLLLPGEVTNMLFSLTEYPDWQKVTNAEEKNLLATYGWTPFFLINSFKETLPKHLYHCPGKFPVNLYWAYNNCLNLHIDFDLRPYLGEEVEVSLYKVAEHLPGFMEPRRGAGRAVVIRYNENIIGAWLDAGRHDAFACSLKGSSREDITGLPWEEWVEEVIDPSHPVEAELAVISPEGIIARYYSAIDRGEIEKAYACHSRRLMRSILFSNMDNRYLYNDSFASGMGISNYRKAELLDIEPIAEGEEGVPGFPEKRQFLVNVYLEVKREITHDSGPQTRFVTLVRETSETGWRIDSIGTGP